MGLTTDNVNEFYVPTTTMTGVSYVDACTIVNPTYDDYDTLLRGTADTYNLRIRRTRGEHEFIMNPNPPAGFADSPALTFVNGVDSNLVVPGTAQVVEVMDMSPSGTVVRSILSGNVAPRHFKGALQRLIIVKAVPTDGEKTFCAAGLPAERTLCRTAAKNCAGMLQCVKQPSTAACGGMRSGTFMASTLTPDGMDAVGRPAPDPLRTRLPPPSDQRFGHSRLFCTGVLLRRRGIEYGHCVTEQSPPAPCKVPQ